MARIRTIKPEFFTSEDIVELEPLARLLYIALWCEADKEGRFSWKPKTFKMRYLPADETNIDALCDALLTRGLVCLYGENLAFIPSFTQHQHINPREKDSNLPSLDEYIESRVSDASVTVDTRAGRKEGREGKGKVDASRRETPIPEDFSVSERVKAWAELNGYDQLETHLANFVDSCRAKGYKYIDWDAAFRNAISKNWAKVKERPKATPATFEGKPIRDPLIYGFDVANGDPLPDGWKLPPTGETRYMAGIGWVLSSPKPKDKPLRVVA